jgi:hypothetical protein
MSDIRCRNVLSSQRNAFEQAFDNDKRKHVQKEKKILEQALDDVKRCIETKEKI